MQIVPADDNKRLIRLGLWWFHRKYNGSEESKYIYEDLKTCGNPLFYKIYRILKRDLHDNISEHEKHQRNAILDVGGFLLWILYKDTAYRQPAVYALKKVLDMKDELMPLIEEYYAEPENWYVNQWSESKQNSKKLKKEGKIGSNELSVEETYFSPEIQSIRMQEINSEIMKQKRKKGL